MKLTSLSFKNYKAFRASETLEIRALTVLIGRNSSGKSVITRLPLLIQRGLSLQTNAPIDLEFDDLDFGSSFVDLIHGRSPHGSIELGASFEKSNGNKIKFRTKIQHVDEFKMQVVSGFSYQDNNKEYHLKWSENKPTQEENDYILDNEEDCTATFQGLFPKYVSLSKLDYLPQLRKDIFQCLENKIIYLGPFRKSPERLYRYPSGSPQSIGFKGEQVPALLGNDALRSDAQLITNVSEWFEKYLGGWRLDLNKQSDMFSLSLNHPTEDLQINLADVGAGIGQVLPIVVQRFYARQTDTLQIVEQPELHLHPAAHGDVADLYIDAVTQSKTQFLIETHSENFLLRIRRRIAEGKLNPEDVIIYWIDDQVLSGEKKLKPIEIDKQGDVDTWPSGIFSEDFQELRAIRSAQKKGKNL